MFNLEPFGCCVDVSSGKEKWIWQNWVHFSKIKNVRYVAKIQLFSNAKIHIFFVYVLLKCPFLELLLSSRRPDKLFWSHFWLIQAIVFCFYYWEFPVYIDWIFVENYPLIHIAESIENCSQNHSQSTNVSPTVHHTIPTFCTFV